MRISARLRRCDSARETVDRLETDGEAPLTLINFHYVRAITCAFLEVALASKG